MPCQKCDCTLIIYNNEEICPRCRCLAVLDSITAIDIYNKLLVYFRNIFDNELNKWDIESLYGNLAAWRENNARQFIKEQGVLDLGKFAAYTLLIVRLTNMRVSGNKYPKSEEEIFELVNKFEKLLEIENECKKINSCYNNVIYLEKFDEKNLTIERILKIFILVENEKYAHFRKTAKIYDIYSKEEAEIKIQEYKKEYENKITNIESRSFTPKEFIESNYLILNAIYSIFMRDIIHAEIFSRLKKYEELFNDPNKLMEFIWTFKLINENIQTVCPYTDFLIRGSRFFKVSEKKIREVLIFDSTNNSIFPLFIKFKNEKLGEVVFISHRFSYFVYTILHAIMNKDLFDNETESRSKEFEKDRVKAEFQKYGFNYKDNILTKELQIDGIAIKNNICYVVECKGWRLPNLIDEPSKKNEIIRDLKGIVKGEKYSVINGERKIKRKPSVIEKVEFIKNNIKKYSNDEIKTIEGIVITISYPPVSEYNNIKMISIEQISELN